MAKMENMKVEVTLNPQDRRLLRNLTKAIDRLARTKWEETGGASGVKRLSEHAPIPLSEGLKGFTLSPETIQRIEKSVNPDLEV